MPYYRFENLRSHHLNPHLSSGEGPVIEGPLMTRPPPAAACSASALPQESAALL